VRHFKVPQHNYFNAVLYKKCMFIIRKNAMFLEFKKVKHFVLFLKVKETIGSFKQYMS